MVGKDMRRAVVFALFAFSLSVAACATGPAADRRAPRTTRDSAGSDTARDRRSHFASAERRFEAGDFAGAAAAFEALLPVYPELEDYCLYYLASSFDRLGETDRAIPLWEHLSQRHPQSLHAAAALLAEGHALRRRGDLERARAVLGDAERSHNEGIARRAAFELAEIDESSGDLAAAQRRFMDLREAAAGTALGRRATERVLELRRRDPGLAPSGEALEEELRLLVREGDHAAAIDLADRLLATAAAEKRPVLLRLRADAERASGATEQALATLEEIFRGHPTSLAGRDALYDYATLLWNRDRDAEAKGAFLEYERRYPGSRGVEVAYAIARIEQAAGDAAQAVASYSRLAREYPSTKQAFEARWRIGWVDYERARYREAARAFAEAAQSNPEQRSEASYWQARALERAGASGEAQSIYRGILEKDPWSYYALCAERRLGGGRAPTAGVVAPAARPEIGPPPLDGRDAYHLIRARELQLAGLHRLARAELRALEREVPDQAALTSFLLESYPAVEGYRDAIRLAYRVRRLEPETLYPLAFWPLVTRHARENDLDPLLVLALMRQESMFDPEARSIANARGLMQLLPSTAERIANRLGAPGAQSELYDPDTNVALGTAYLEQLLARYGGDRTKALAAYNGGENAVAKWEARFGDMESDEFVESITYRETRDYVKRVLANYRRYQGQYAVAEVLR